jgi:DNA-directed RNA polymerase specialized sigma24 family protein
MTAEKKPGDYLTQEELAHALRSVLDVELARVQDLARLNALRGYPGTWEDLLHEAICRAYMGKRPCPRDVEPIAFLAGVMKSIGSSERKKLKGRQFVEINDEPEEDETPGKTVSLACTAPSPEELASVQQQTDRMLAIFADDADAQMIIMGRLEGLQGKDLRALTTLSETAFDSKLRLIKRRLLKMEKGGSDD